MAVSVEAAPASAKLFYRIQEVARLVDLKPHVLRYWETEFPRLSPRKDANDQRRYTQGDIDLIVKIKKLLYEDRFTIAGAKRRLRQADVKEVPPPRPNAESVQALHREVSDLLDLLDNPQRPAA